MSSTADVAGDPEQPRPEAARFAQRPEAGEREQERVLDEVLLAVPIAHPVADRHPHGPGVTGEQLVERPLVAVPRRDDETLRRSAAGAVRSG